MVRTPSLNSIRNILNRATKAKEPRKEKPKKSYFDLKPQRKRQQKNNIRAFFKEKLAFVFAFVESIGLNLETVGFKKKEPNWTPDDIAYTFNEKTGAEMAQARKTRAKIVSVSRKVNYFSDLTYTRFKRSAEHQECPIDLPTAYKTKRICEEAVQDARFEKLQRNNHGFYVAPDKKICRVIEENWEILSKKITNNTIR